MDGVPASRRLKKDKRVEASQSRKRTANTAPVLCIGESESTSQIIIASPLQPRIVCIGMQFLSRQPSAVSQAQMQHPPKHGTATRGERKKKKRKQKQTCRVFVCFLCPFARGGSFPCLLSRHPTACLVERENRQKKVSTVFESALCCTGQHESARPAQRLLRSSATDRIRDRPR